MHPLPTHVEEVSVGDGVTEEHWLHDGPSVCVTLLPPGPFDRSGQGRILDALVGVATHECNTN